MPNEKKKKKKQIGGQRQRNKERKNNGETKKKTTTPKPGRRLKSAKENPMSETMSHHAIEFSCSSLVWNKSTE